MAYRTITALLTAMTSITATAAAAQTVPAVSDSLLFQATLGTKGTAASPLTDPADNPGLADLTTNQNSNPLFTIGLGSQLLFRVAASGSSTGKANDFLTATFRQDATQGTFYTIGDPNVNGTVQYPIGTMGGNSYRQTLTFDRLGSFSGSIDLNLALADPDFRQSGGTPVDNMPLPAKREAPTLTFRVNVVDPTAAVPEPATWATMMLGFAMVGLTARRRRSTRAVVA